MALTLAQIAKHRPKKIQAKALKGLGAALSPWETFESPKENADKSPAPSPPLQAVVPPTPTPAEVFASKGCDVSSSPLKSEAARVAHFAGRALAPYHPESRVGIVPTSRGALLNIKRASQDVHYANEEKSLLIGSSGDDLGGQISATREKVATLRVTEDRPAKRAKKNQASESESPQSRIARGLDSTQVQDEGSAEDAAPSGLDVADSTQTEASHDNSAACGLPTGKQQRIILEWLASRQIDSGLEHTPRIRRKALAEDLGIPGNSVAKQVARLVRSGFVERVQFRKGRGDAGTIFRIQHASRVIALVQGHRAIENKAVGSNGDKRRQIGKSAGLMPSRSREEANELQIWVERLNFEKHEIGVPDLQRAWIKSTLSFSDFLLSAEHVAFYLNSPKASSLYAKPAWATAQLSKGFFGAPTGFISWEEQLHRKAMLEAEAKEMRVREYRIRAFKADLSVWLHELTPDRKAQLLQGTMLTINSPDVIVKAHLRGVFANETNRVDVLDLIVAAET